MIRHQFRQLYGITLPESIDLSETTTDDFYNFLLRQIEANGTGVNLTKIDKPRISLIYEKAKRKLDQYRRRARLAGRGIRSFLDIDYSYDPANYHPLGIKLFSAKVGTPTSKLREILKQEPTSPRFMVEEGSDAEEESRPSKPAETPSGGDATSAGDVQRAKTADAEKDTTEGNVSSNQGTANQGEANQETDGSATNPATPEVESSSSHAGAEDAPSSPADPSTAQETSEAAKVEVQKEKVFYQRESGGTNPYDWEFDLCNVTLSNFKYRRMSLVRDYDQLIDEPQENAAFEATFSLAPRPLSDDGSLQTPLEDRFHVVPCDPTQGMAIQQAQEPERLHYSGPAWHG